MKKFLLFMLCLLISNQAYANGDCDVFFSFYGIASGLTASTFLFALLFGVLPAQENKEFGLFLTVCVLLIALSFTCHQLHENAVKEKCEKIEKKSE